MTEDAGELLGHRRAVETVELDAQHLAHPLEHGEHRPQRVTPVDLVGPVAQDEQHPGVSQGSREEDHEVERRAVCPVQVFDHEYEWPLCGDTGEHCQEQLEHPAPAELAGRLLTGGGRAELGQQAGQFLACGAEHLVELLRRQVGGQGAQRVDHRGEREALAAELHAAADENAGLALCCFPDQLLDQPGLAHSGLAGDQRHGWLADPRLGESSAEPCELF